MSTPFRYFNSSPEMIRLTVMMYIRYPLSLRQVEDLLFERASTSVTRQCGSGGTVSVRCSPRRSGSDAFIVGHFRNGAGTWTRCSSGSMERRIISGGAVDHEGEVLEVFATKRRDRRAALKFLKRAMKRYGRSRSIVTDRLRSYRSAMKVIGNAADQECGRWLNNRAENSHQPFRRRERSMAKFRDMKTLQRFVAAHASIHNHFNLDRHLNSRDIFKQNRAAALAEWRQLAA
jgi:putative transposase